MFVLGGVYVTNHEIDIGADAFGFDTVSGVCFLFLWVGVSMMSHPLNKYRSTYQQVWSVYRTVSTCTGRRRGGAKEV